MYLWSLETSVKNTVIMSSVSERVVIQWFQYLRDICSTWLSKHPYKLGGPGLIVEIDESIISKSKFHRGRVVPQRWIFDGYCRTSGKGFPQFVDDRTAQTLLPLFHLCNSISNPDR